MISDVLPRVPVALGLFQPPLVVSHCPAPRLRISDRLGRLALLAALFAEKLIAQRHEREADDGGNEHGGRFLCWTAHIARVTPTYNVLQPGCNFGRRNAYFADNSVSWVKVVAGERVTAHPATSRRQPYREANMGGPYGNRNARFRHGHSHRDAGKSPTYSSWDNMIARCTRPSCRAYAHYGGRGITVCDRWRDSFVAFLADMGERPSLIHTIDRWPDRNGNYEPGNCRWATHIEQSRNSSKVKAVIRSDGRRYATIIDAARDTGIDYTGIVKACRGTISSSGGFFWKYASNRRE